MAKKKLRFQATVGGISIDLRCQIGSPMADAVHCLRQRYVDKLQLLELACTALYAPEGAIMRGASRDEVLERIALADDIYQRQRQSVLARVQLMPQVQLEVPQLPEASPTLPPAQTGRFEETINLDDEDDYFNEEQG